MKTRKGFTLIELLIVITIIGILAVALLPRVLGAPQRARDASRKAALQQIAGVLETYMSDNGTYPALTDGGCIDDAGTSGDLLAYFDGTSPKDPLSTNGIYHTSSGTLITSTEGCYYYQSLTRNGVVDVAYLIVANTEKDCLVTDANCADTTNLQASDADSVEEYQSGGTYTLFPASAGTGNLNAYALMR